MNSPDFDEISEYFFQCDPRRPLEANDPRYIDFDSAPGSRYEDALGARVALERTVRRHTSGRASGYSFQLFSGYPGSGKTTELKRLVYSLEQDSAVHPIYLDADEFLNTKDPLRIDYVLAVIAGELDKRARRAQGQTEDGLGSYMERFWNFLCNTDIEFKDFKVKSPVVEVGAMLKTNDYFGALVAKAMRRELQRFIQDARDSMVASLQVLKRTYHTEHILVVFDSLEKPEPSDAQRAAAEELFIIHGEHLRLPCHVIYTYPLWLSFQVTNLPLTADSTPQLLPMVKLWEKNGEPNPAGRRLLRALLQARVPLDRLFGQQEAVLTEQMLEASGGYFRDVLRLMRSILNRSDSLPVSARAVEREIQNLENDYRLVYRDQDLELLAHIALERELPQRDDLSVLRIQKLFKDRQVLSFRNGGPWYDIHPMLKRLPAVRARIEQLQKAKASAAALPASTESRA